MCLIRGYTGNCKPKIFGLNYAPIIECMCKFENVIRMLKWRLYKRLCKVLIYSITHLFKWLFKAHTYLTLLPFKFLVKKIRGVPKFSSKVHERLPYEGVTELHTV